MQKTVLEAEVANQGGIAGFVLALAWKSGDGKPQQIVSDLTWTYATERGAAEGQPVQRRGGYGDGPWNAVFSNAAGPSRVPAGVFELLPGFQVEKLFTAPKDQLGSWVCIAFDNRGRLLASDQGDKGICRITLPPVGVADGETKVERLDFSKCQIQPTAAQGMLYAFDSLYFSINGGPGSGLYRARDTNGDDQFDECVRLRQFRGGGEHGPHALRLSPDGKRIFVICGNHTLPPFDAGEELTNPDYTSRIPTNWSEDHILPRMWDANGHARGILAPGGWIASTDVDGKTWDIWSVGYRNPYDMAFNADGELFAYDADMEWDVGTPWYRPTRVVHATSGSEFGWRSGSGKWPNHYLDSLPPMVNIGPGSPVGVEFGYGCRFPAKYQKALYICDWTFGTMYAIHIEPSGSSYTAVKEEFVSRTPLPLTDVATGPDGALYFSVGGRGTQSELFRVTYSGPESTVPAELKDARQAGLRSSRRSLENWHAGRSGGDLQPSADSATFIQTLQSMGQGGDRFLRAASRNAFYHSQLFADLMQPQNVAEMDLSAFEPGDRLYVLLALIRAPFTQLTKSRGLTETQIVELEDAVRAMSIRQLQGLDFASLNRDQKLDYLRVLSLLFLRLGPPENETRAAFISRIDAQFPSSDAELNRELCQVLIYSPLADDRRQDCRAARSGIQSHSHRRHAGSAGAKPRLRWRDRSVDRQLRRTSSRLPTRSVSAMPLRAGLLILAKLSSLGLSEPGNGPGVPASRDSCETSKTKPSSTPVNATVCSLKPLVLANPTLRQNSQNPRDRGKNGRSTKFVHSPIRDSKAAISKTARRCSRPPAASSVIASAVKAAATGPDLTQLAGRFNVRDLTEAIIEPSKVISDQYRGSTVVTKDGLSISGRVIAETGTSVTVLTNPEDPTKITEIAKSDVEELQPSSVSIMPADLLKPLNQDEVLDLLAYLLSRGEKNNPMFRR
jgi:putative heme-binding domain-containing protein